MKAGTTGFTPISPTPTCGQDVPGTSTATASS